MFEANHDYQVERRVLGAMWSSRAKQLDSSIAWLYMSSLWTL